MNTEMLVKSFDGTQLYTRSFGAGEHTIVLCDGLGCSGFIWRYLEEYLADHFRVVHWHYRGHGYSQHPPAGQKSLTMQALCKDLEAVMDAHKVKKGVMLGHSMGVQVLLQFAVEHPQRVSALVPICGSYGRPLDTFHDNGLLGLAFPYIRDVIVNVREPSLLAWRTFLRSSLPFRFAMMFEVNGRLVRGEDFKRYFEDLVAIDPEVFVRLLDDVREHTVEDKLHLIDTPALVVAGERDTFTPMWLSQRMEHLMPNAELLVVRGGSHITPLEAPELVELKLERFLERHVSTPKQKPRRKTPTARRSGQRKRA